MSPRPAASRQDPAAVSAPARVEAIIVKVKAMAADDGLAPEVAERAYRAMIAAFEDFERAEWAKRNARRRSDGGGRGLQRFAT